MGKSKEIQAAKGAATKANKSGKKKKWSKGRVKEKVNNKVLFDKKAESQLMKDVAKLKFISVSKISDTCSVTGGCSLAGMKFLESKGLIRPVVIHSRQKIFVPVEGAKLEGEAAEEATKAPAKKGKKAPAEKAEK